jgi:hypothetical protein
MPNESIILDEDGKPTHIRVTSDDGSESTLYKYDNDFWANLTGNHRGSAVEVADHLKDGTTNAYEYDNGFWANLTGNHRGRQKNDK